MISSATRIPRRAMLRGLVLTGLAAAVPRQLLGAAVTRADWWAGTTRYLETLARRDGGYGWEDQAQSHLTPTFAVIGCYHLLDEAPLNKAALAEFVRTHHPSRLKKLEQEHREFEFQQMQALVWLGEDISAFREQVGGWRKPTVYLKQYEQHGYPVFINELSVLVCRALLGLPSENLSPEYLDYLKSRRRSNGSFNSTPSADGGDGHVVNTWWGLQGLQTLGRTDEKKNETIEWVRRCQLPTGGFTWQPQPEFAGVDDVAYTWAAVRGLQLLGAAPAKREACIDYVRSLFNSDGGFGDRPGWLSNPMATYYALDTLSALGGLENSLPLRKRPTLRSARFPGNFEVFSIQIEAHGQGSPAEAVDLARALRIHLWGAKNASSKWLAAAQAAADQQRVPVRFFVANEEYGTWVNVAGLGTYSHTSDIIAPPEANFGSSLANRDVVSWEQFRERRLAPLLQAHGRLVWQFGENEPLVRLLLDDSLERGGYAAISTFHFGNPDFTNSEPFLHRYRGRLPFIALQDAHGEEPWWFADMTTGFRTLFLAPEPTWEGWLKALENNWVAAVRHDAVSSFKTWTHAGRPEVLESLRNRESSWRWWDNPKIQRPLLSIVAVRPQDEFEAARPERGITLRVRCAWENTTQGRPKKAITELVKLTVDEIEVQPRLVSIPAGGQAARRDHYHEFRMPTASPGKHSATATVRRLEDNTTLSRTVEFDGA